MAEQLAGAIDIPWKLVRVVNRPQLAPLTPSLIRSPAPTSSLPQPRTEAVAGAAPHPKPSYSKAG